MIGGSFLRFAVSRHARPFAMQIVDTDTGAAVPGIRVTSDNGIVCYSTGAGSTPHLRASDHRTRSRADRLPAGRFRRRMTSPV